MAERRELARRFPHRTVHPRQLPRWLGLPARVLLWLARTLGLLRRRAALGLLSREGERVQSAHLAGGTSAKTCSGTLVAMRGAHRMTLGVSLHVHGRGEGAPRVDKT